MFILVSYDIPNDKRRLKIAKILEDYGDRVQYSVFECDLPEKQFQKLVKELEQVLEESEDSIRIYLLCQTCVTKIRAMGQAEPPAEAPVVYIV